MSVGSWQPVAARLDDTVVARLLEAAALSDVADFALSSQEIDSLAAFARDGGAGSPVDWATVGAALADEALIALIRLFVLAEMRFPGWKGGDRSPVIALASVLKGRGHYPADLTTWIRGHSDNRFLPYGSLARRL